MTERFTIRKDKTKEYYSAYRGIRQLAMSESLDRALRAFAEATEDLYRQQFEAQGFKKSNAIPSIEWLVGKRKPKYEMGTRPPGDDHPSIWLKNGKPILYLSQPYNLGDKTIKEMVEFAEKWQLDFWVRTWPGFHFPGNILSVWWTKKNTFGFPQI